MISLVRLWSAKPHCCSGTRRQTWIRKYSQNFSTHRNQGTHQTIGITANFLQGNLSISQIQKYGRGRCNWLIPLCCICIFPHSVAFVKSKYSLTSQIKMPWRLYLWLDEFIESQMSCSFSWVFRNCLLVGMPLLPCQCSLTATMPFMSQQEMSLHSSPRIFLCLCQLIGMDYTVIDAQIFSCHFKLLLGILLYLFSWLLSTINTL